MSVDLLLDKANHDIVTMPPGIPERLSKLVQFYHFFLVRVSSTSIWVLEESGSGPWIPAVHFFALYIIEDMFDKTNRRNLGLVKIGRTYSN